MLNKELFVEYSELKQAIAQKEARIEELQPQILEQTLEFSEQNNATPEIEGVGKFIITKRKKWTYTSAVELLNKQLKDKKQEEERSGEATFVEEPNVMFKAIK